MLCVVSCTYLLCATSNTEPLCATSCTNLLCAASYTEPLCVASCMDLPCCYLHRHTMFVASFTDAACVASYIYLLYVLLLYISNILFLYISTVWFFMQIYCVLLIQGALFTEMCFHFLPCVCLYWFCWKFYLYVCFSLCKLLDVVLNIVLCVFLHFTEYFSSNAFQFC